MFSGSLSAQTLYFQEDFGQWVGSPEAPPAWTTLSANNCAAGNACYWGPSDAFDPLLVPAPSGPDGAGGYARAASSQLGLGQAPSLLSPPIDLSQIDTAAPLTFHISLINPSTQPVDGDGIQVSFSSNGGNTWSVQLLDFNAYTSWTEKVLPVPVAFRTSSFRIRFDALGNYSSGEIGLDALVVQDTTPVCAAIPTQISLTGATQVCRDQASDWVYFSPQQSSAADYAFLLTDPAQQLITVIPGDSLDFNELPPAQYRVYGISYSGSLQAVPGLPISTVEGSLCHHLSTNHAQVEVRAVTGALSATSDYNGAAISTYGASDGTLTVLGQGGTAPYSYLWQTQPPQSGPTATNLSAGSYAVQITDATGCAGTALFMLQQPDSLTVTISQPDSSQIRCEGDSAGTLAATVSGGVPPYTYAWSGSGQQGPTLSSLPAGSYSLVVSDANGALAVASYHMESPPPLAATVALSPPACGEGSDGSLQLSVSGGHAPYAYSWAHGPETAVLEGLPAGPYVCTVTDAYGCTLAVQATLPAAEPLVVDMLAVDPACGEEKGWLAAQASGGVPPYQYAWAHGDTGAEIFDLPAGIYTLHVTDEQGCEKVYDAILDARVDLQAEAEVVPDNGQRSGEIALVLTGGLPPYVVTWADSAQGQTRQGLAEGTYSARVSDAQGCETELLIEVPATETLECLQVHMGFSPNGDGVNDRWVIPCLERFPENELTIVSRWGQEVYFQENYQNDWDGTAAGQALPAGTYYYLLKLNGPTDRRFFKGTLSLIR